MTAFCALCELRFANGDDVLCVECREQTNRSMDEITDPVEGVLSHHQHVCFLSDLDSTLCRCGLVFEGGPAFHRRHLAQIIYESLNLPGPSPWILGPDSSTRDREGFR